MDKNEKEHCDKLLNYYISFCNVTAVSNVDTNYNKCKYISYLLYYKYECYKYIINPINKVKN
jgi:hypothetical protein